MKLLVGWFVRVDVETTSTQHSKGVPETALSGRLNYMDPASSWVSPSCSWCLQRHRQLWWSHSPTLMPTTDTFRTKVLGTTTQFLIFGSSEGDIAIL